MIRKLPKWIIFGAFILSLSAGMVNTVAFLSFTHDAVSHMTGLVTKTGIAFYNSDQKTSFETIGLLSSFFLGAIFSGIIVGSEQLQFGRKYGVALLIQSILLFLSCAFFKQESHFGEFLAAAACGLQNAMVATYSGSVIRTTHVTGILSDMGSIIGNYLGGRPSEPLRLYLLSTLFLGFFLGSYFGAFFFSKFNYNTLIIPAMISGSVGTLYLAIRILSNLKGELEKIKKTIF